MAHHHQSQGSHEEEVLGKAYDARLMRRLLAYLKPYRLQVVIALVAIVLKAGADVLGPYLTKVAIDKYLAHKPGAGHSFLDRFLSSQPLTGIAQIGMAYIALLSFSFLLEFAQTYLMQWTGQKVMFDLRSQIYRHLQQMHVAFFDRNPVGRLVTRVTTDVDALNEMFTAGVVSIFEDVFVLAGIIAIMLNMSWQLALIAFAVLPLIYIGTAIFRKHVRDSYRRIRVAIARINAYLQEHITGIVPLQLFNREEKAFAEFKAINATHMLAFKDAIMAYSLYYPMVEILSATAVASIIWYGGHRILAGTITLGVLVAFMQYAQRFFRPIQDLSEKYNILQSAMASSERIFKLLDTKPEIASLPGARLPDGPGHIEFEHVWFAYRRIPLEDPKRSGAEPKLYPQVSAEQPKELLATGGTASQAVPIVSKEFLGGAEPGAPCFPANWRNEPFKQLPHICQLQQMWATHILTSDSRPSPASRLPPPPRAGSPVAAAPARLPAPGLCTGAGKACSRCRAGRAVVGGFPSRAPCPCASR
jgi:ATP-binding cassette subfamily B protein